MAGLSKFIISICFLLQLVTAIPYPAADSQKSSSPKVTWGGCPSQIPPGVDCGSINVPIAYQKDNSVAAKGDKTVKLGLTRLNHTGKAAKQGILFYNPGGPGAGASLLVAAAGFVPQVAFSSELRDAYDIIGLDPRGVGQSTPVQCDPKLFNERVSTFVHMMDMMRFSTTVVVWARAVLSSLVP
ncbi:hypothetical protein FDECE_8020 [Fusarium decemcellulare]|nr:hypothetical protein FDECE_8020 [Fusarium decemcellulare]